MTNPRVDLNCDMGESFGTYVLGNDAAIMPYITSANIACGFHAGDPTVMRKTIGLAKEHGVGVGVHPGYQDLVGFGRRAMSLSADEVYDICVYQIGAFLGVARALGVQATHFKAHGALYNAAAVDIKLATAMARAVRNVDSSLVFVGLAGSKMIEAAANEGLATAQEVFADRAYQPDGTLVPRSHPQAVHTSAEQALNQVLEMVAEGTVTTLTGEKIKIQADTICLHGDDAHAVEFAKAINTALKYRGIAIRGLAGR